MENWHMIVLVLVIVGAVLFVLYKKGMIGKSEGMTSESVSVSAPIDRFEDIGFY